jgi:hypothetical protein
VQGVAGGPGGPGPQGPPGVGIVTSGAVDFAAYYSGTTTLSAASGSGSVKVGGPFYINNTAAALRSVSSGYLDGGRVFISGTTPTATAAGDIWIDTSGTSGYTQSLTSSGYTRLPNGLIFQWGAASVSSGTSTSVSLNISTTSWSRTVCSGNSQNTGDGHDGDAGVTSSGTSSFTVFNTLPISITVQWISVGY